MRELIIKRQFHLVKKDASDYIKHKHPDRKALYIARHKNNEDWTKAGVKAAGWMSKSLLWND